MGLRNWYFEKSVQAILCVVRLGTRDFLILKAPSRFHIPHSNCTALNSAHHPVPRAHPRGRAFRAKAVLMGTVTQRPAVPLSLNPTALHYVSIAVGILCVLERKEIREEGKERNEGGKEVEGSLFGVVEYIITLLP